MRIHQHIKSLLAIVCLVLAVAFCAGKLSAATILLRSVPRVTVNTLGEQLWSSYAAISQRGETIFDSWTAWNTNSMIFGLSNFTAIGPVHNPSNAGDLVVPYTALTRRHVYVRGHDNGSTNGVIDTTHFLDERYVFLTASNEPVAVTFLASIRHQDIYGDYCVILASNDIPAGIACMKMVNTAALNAKLASEPTVFYWPRRSPLLGTCQHNIVGTVEGGTASGHSMYIGGDSGSPDFYVLNGEMVMTRGRTTSGWSAQMQADCDALCTWAGLNPTNYQIQLLDLSQFP